MPIVKSRYLSAYIKSLMQLLIVFLIALYSQYAAATQSALVVKTKATIYADIHKKHPIGYVPQWKTILVGSVARNGGQVLPIVVSKNRIAYISVDDISFGRDVYSVQNTYRRFDNGAALIPKKDHFTVNTSLFFGSANIQDPTFGASNIDTNFAGFGIQKNYYVTSIFGWYLGFNYEQSSAADGVSITNLMFRTGARYKLFKYKKLDFNLMANIGFSPRTTLESETFASNGFSFGNEGGFEIYMPINHRMDFVAFGGYEVQKIMGIDLPGTLGEFNPLIIGLKLNAGLAIYY